jgi:hypothetical protein
MRVLTRLLCAALVLGWGTASPAQQTAPVDGLSTNGKLPVVGGFWNLLKLPSSTSPAASQTAAPSSPLLAPAPDVIPAELVHIRVSLRLLEQNIEQAVVRDTDIVDTILGTSIRGQARTVATTTLSLRDDPHQAVFDVVFTGAVNSQTRGENGPVVLYGWANTPFRVTKQLTLNADGMHLSPTVTYALTSSMTTKIDTKLSGLRGRIAERVAWRRSAERRPEADAIASRHAADQIRAEFDKEVRQTVARMEKALLDGTRDLHLDFAGAAPTIHFSSTPEHLDIVLHRPHANEAEWSLTPPAIDGNPALAVRAHRVVVRRAFANASLQQLVQTLTSRKKSDAGVETVKTSAPQGVTFEMRWSADRNWLILDHLDSPSPLQGPRPIRLPVAQTSPPDSPAAP